MPITPQDLLQNPEILLHLKGDPSTHTLYLLFKILITTYWYYSPEIVQRQSWGSHLEQGIFHHKP